MHANAAIISRMDGAGVDDIGRGMAQVAADEIRRRFGSACDILAQALPDAAAVEGIRACDVVIACVGTDDARVASRNSRPSV